MNVRLLLFSATQVHTNLVLEQIEVLWSQDRQFRDREDGMGGDAQQLLGFIRDPAENKGTGKKYG